MKRIIFTYLFVLVVIGGYSQSAPRNIMLVLGSDKPEIITSRIKVAVKLYNTQRIDKIIVSGGCAAHSSKICEASEMLRQLVNSRVPEKIIYKEENSKTTAQNYVFSRVLKDENGNRIIRAGDSLFVVSDHWHAIAVAARFRKYDQVHARFFIEGEIDPKENDALDYAGIFNKISDNNEFVLKNTWPTPAAVYKAGHVENYLFTDRVHIVTANDTIVKSINEWAKEINLPIPGEVDAIAADPKKNSLLVFKGADCIEVGRGKTVATVPMHKIISLLPADVKYIDAAFLRNGELYLFYREQLFIAGRFKNQYKVSQSIRLTQWLTDLPFSWGNGNIAAADYDEKSGKVRLFKNREVIEFNINQRTHQGPQKLKIEWRNPK